MAFISHRNFWHFTIYVSCSYTSLPSSLFIFLVSICVRIFSYVKSKLLPDFVAIWKLSLSIPRFANTYKLFWLFSEPARIHRRHAVTVANTENRDAHWQLRKIHMNARVVINVIMCIHFDILHFYATIDAFHCCIVQIHFGNLCICFG